MYTPFLQYAYKCLVYILQIKYLKYLIYFLIAAKIKYFYLLLIKILNVFFSSNTNKNT